jgi:multidrug efflux pump subunit AcrB
MMWIVKIALRAPYTFTVLAVLLLIGGALSALQSIDAAIAEVTAECQTILKTMPPGATPPNILSYNAANVPVLQLSVGGAQFSEQELYDFATNFIRTQLATVQGSSIPLPYGGKTLRDIANVRDGYTPQVNMVVSNGIKAALLPVLKNGNASKRWTLCRG